MMNFRHLSSMLNDKPALSSLDVQPTHITISGIIGSTESAIGNKVLSIVFRNKIAY